MKLLASLFLAFTALLLGTGPAARLAVNADTTVTIRNQSFSPASVTVSPGGQVTWKNDDDRDHTVVAGDGSFSSGNIKAGDSWSHTFSKAGTFSYKCSLHPRMKGSVVVKD